MGMFDKPKYLTGDEGFVSPGETFYLHRARIEGTVNINGTPREQAKLEVSHTADGPREVVYTSGAGVVGQIKRMDASDYAAMPMHVRLDEVPSQRGNATRVLNPANAPAPSDRGDFYSDAFDRPRDDAPPPF